MILGLETSCDETAAALVDDDGVVHAGVVASQAELHARYGGVVPEVASRRHLELCVPMVEQALAEAGCGWDGVDAIAVTEGPGLIGALLVGLATAKALAFARQLPLIPVDHLHGHVASLYLAPEPVEPPFLLLLASGGHTLLAEVDGRGPGFRVIGQTLDDAAGEAFDKGARLLGVGYPGGAALERLAREGDDRAVPFPVAMAGHGGLDFSFSGLKTALRTAVLERGEEARADLAAGYQRAIVRSLVMRTMQAIEASGRDRLAVVGGVAANSVLRSAFQEACDRAGIALSLAPLELCSDNAVMIASAARYCQPVPYPGYLARDAYATA